MGDRVVSRAIPWFRDAVASAELGDTITWEITFMLHPTPEGPQPVIMFYAEMPAAVLGMTHADVSFMPVNRITEETVGNDVRAAAERLRGERSKQLSLSNGNGHPAAGKGLLGPRGR